MNVSKPKKIKIQGAPSEFWYVRVTKGDGKRTWRVTGTDDYQEALKFRAKVLEEVIAEEKRIAKRPLSVCTAQFLEHKRSRVEASTMVKVTRCTKRWLDFFGSETSITNLDVTKIEAFFRKLKRDGLSASSLNYERVILSNFFNAALKRKWVDHNPVQQTEKFATEKKAPKVITEADVDALLDTLKDKYPEGVDLVFVATRTGLRRGTLLSLTYRDVDWNAQQWRIPAKKMKAREDFTAPILDEAFEVLETRRDAAKGQGSIFEEIPFRRFKALAKEAGLGDVTFHDLRRSFLQRCCRNGVPFDIAMKLGDWRDPQVVLNHYRGMQKDELVEGLKTAFVKEETLQD